METKRITLIAASSVAAATLIFSTISAFTKRMKSKKPAKRSNRMLLLTKNLSLTDEQVTTIQPILEAHSKEMESIRKSEKQIHDNLEKEIKKSEATFAKEMLEVLTPSQNLKFHDNLAKGIENKDLQANIKNGKVSV